MENCFPISRSRQRSKSNKANANFRESKKNARNENYLIFRNRNFAGGAKIMDVSLKRAHGEKR